MSPLDGLPMVKDATELVRVHSAGGVYFVSGTGEMHGRIDCDRAFSDAPERVIGNPRWRWVRDVDRRRLGLEWCKQCCNGNV